MYILFLLREVNYGASALVNTCRQKPHSITPNLAFLGRVKVFKLLPESAQGFLMHL
jgi:hypothetical protein